MIKFDYGHRHQVKATYFVYFTMNAKQQLAFNAVVKGQSILLTGSAGTGKSFVMTQVIKWAKENDKKIGITASTGLSAYLIRGRTIHSFLGIGLGKKSPEMMAQFVMSKNKPLMKRLIALDILIIDEISMIDAELLDKISSYLSIIRKNVIPFGGVQLVLSGDFAQLPPISRKYCFEAEAFKTANVTTILLDDLVRQEGDTLFKDILEELRWGVCTKHTLKILKSLYKTEFANGVIPTRLYSHNTDVDRINEQEFKKLVESGAETYVYDTTYSKHPMAKHWAESIKVPEKVQLCVGAQVYITWNLQGMEQPCPLMNGTRAVVVALSQKNVSIQLVNGNTVVVEPYTLTSEEDEKITTTFMPLKLAYAISIHKSQGMTLDAVEIDLGEKIFEYGQAYTALSRARTLSSVRLISVKASSFKTHPKVNEFYKK
jgi:ATP-dependent DNA helicase PIF1